MDQITGFLSKYKNQLIANGLLTENIISVIKDETDITLSTDQFNLKNNHLYLKTSPKVKLSIFLHKEVIIEKINQLLNKKVVNDIR